MAAFGQPLRPAHHDQGATPHPPKKLISRTGRAYRDAVLAARAASTLALAGADLGPHPTGIGTRPLDVRVALYPPDRRVRDIDNTQKALLDAMQHAGLYANDAQIQRLLLETHQPDRASGGRVEVRITEYTPSCN